MLVVNGDMKLIGPNTVTITAVKNFPALLIGHDLTFEDVNTILNATGLVCVTNQIDCRNKLNCKFNVKGAVSIVGETIKNTTDVQVNIEALPDNAATQIWLTPGTAQRWSSAAGAVFQQIRRN